MALLLLCLSVTMVVVIFEPVPGPDDLAFTEGIVVSSSWQGLRHPKFEVRVDAAPRLTFQPKPPGELPQPIAEIIKPGATVRLGHTDRTISYFIDNLKVYSLEVDGTVVYSLDDYRRAVASDRPWHWTICVGSAIVGLTIIARRIHQKRATRSVDAPIR